MIFKKPWLLLPAQIAFQISHPLLKVFGKIRSPRSYPWQQFEWRGLHFSNPLGVCGGLDKNAEYLSTWWTLGAGFVEVGTVTPQPQTENPGQILSRDNHFRALWNKMGFPNQGVQKVKTRLSKIKRPYFTPIFINIGKNRSTDNKDAVQDYLICIRELFLFADAFVVNISSPNTTGLRELLKPENLIAFLTPLIAECSGRKPLLLKLSPDMTNDEFINLLLSTDKLGIDGWVISNTTLKRAPGLDFPNEGGVSGAPLAERSKELLKLAVNALGDKCKSKLLISVGGVLTAEDVFERLRMGAHLVQSYSALVFEGPLFFQKVATEAGHEYS